MKPIIEHIEAYTEGEITLEELRSIAMENGVEDLEAEIALFRQMFLAIEAEGLKRQLGELYRQQTKEQDNVRPLDAFKRYFPALSIAACLLLLLGVFFLFRPKEEADLYSQFEYVDPGIPLLMSETQRYELYNALTYYSEQDYTTAIELLEALNADEASFRDTAYFYLGASYLYSGEPEKGMTYLLDPSLQASSDFKDRAEWLYALSLLKAGREEALKAVLTSIQSNSEHQFSEQAAALKEKLDE